MSDISEIYLDWNATAPPHGDVLAAMAKAQAFAWGNPSSTHHAGRRARAVVETGRERLAELLGFEARSVVFTSGATEANNLALHDAPALVTSRLEHPSVVRVAERLERNGRWVHWLPVPACGAIEPEAVERALADAPDGARVALQAANHETGVIQPIRQVAEVTCARGARLHVDAAQAFGKLAPEAYQMADSLALSAHKLRGPKGIGALAFRGRVPEPFALGGAQERGLRPGTLDPVLVAGFAAAAELARTGPERYRALGVLRDELEERLGSHADVNGAGPRLPHVSNLSFEGWRGDELVAALDLAGVRVSSGSACSAGTAEPPASVSAMLGRERALSAVRISLGDTIDAAATRAAIDRILRVVTPGATSSESP